MKKYEKYKDSGIEWLGEIPEHWETIKIQYLANGGRTLFLDGDWIESDVIEESGIRYLTTGNIGPGYYKEQGSGFINEETFERLNCTEVYPGDLVISRLNEPIGRACIIPDLGYRIVTSVDNVILRPKSGYSVNFLKHLMNSQEYALYTGLISRGATMKRISRGLLGRISIPTPSLSEQTAIASFLDHKTTLIDILIEKKEKLIEKLKLQRQAIINEAVTGKVVWSEKEQKMIPLALSKVDGKDSGIEWLGEIPKHWEVVKLKKICEAYGRIGYRGYTTSDIVNEGEGAITISPSNMKGDFMTFSDSTYISWEKYNESPEIKIYNDDILMVKTGSTFGKVGIVKNLKLQATINPQILVLKNTQVNPDYLFHLLRTPVIQAQVETEVIGSTIPTISQTKVLNFTIPLPPQTEIVKILNYIEKKVYLIENAVETIQVQNEKLKRYRQSLISEAVTGKIDVRDWSFDNAQKPEKTENN